MAYRKEINPVYYQVGKRKRIDGYLGELYDGDELIHDKTYSTYSQAERALDALVFELLRAAPAEAPAEPASTCCFCQGLHSPQRCPEMRAALFAPLDVAFAPEPWPV